MRITFWDTIRALAKLVRRLISYSETQCFIVAVKSCGKNLILETGGSFSNLEFVEIGDDVTINNHAWFSIVPLPGEEVPSLKICRGTYIGRFATISCVNRIVIGEDVMISDRVLISDTLHSFKDITLPISRQPLYSPGPVEIGHGTWIGIGVSILPNVKIGKNCVIGANAVVTNSIPDYHVAAGAPARIIQRIGR